MTLSSEILDEIRSQVTDGYWDRATILESIREFFPDEHDTTHVEAAVDAALARNAEEMTSWPVVTDCDRIRAAFESLASSGFVAIENCGVTRQEGVDIVWQQGLDREHETGIRPSGFCFFHQQDVMNAIEDGRLYLCFGTLQDVADIETVEDQRDRDVGEAVAAACRAQGFEVAWDGSPDTRILIPHFRWQHRGSARALR